MKVQVEKKYRDAGWSVINCPRDSPQDLICSNGRILHFVRMNPPSHLGLYIQNAFANIAIPVVAMIENGKCELEDINLQRSVEIKPVVKPIVKPIVKSAAKPVMKPKSMKKVTPVNK